MKSARSHFFFPFAWILLCAFISPIASMAQEKAKPSTTVDAWRQALPSPTETQPVAETAEARPAVTSIEDTKKTLLSIEQNWMESLRVRDADSLSQVISADFTFANSRLGEMKTRSQYLEYALRDLKLTSFEFDKTTIQLFGRTAIVSSQLKQKGSVGGEDWSGNYLVTDVWINRDGNWRVVSRHESVVAAQR